MNVAKKQDLSIYYWLVNLFSDTPMVKVVDGFPEDDLEIPTIAVELDEIDTYERELGTRSLGVIRSWYIDVFASSKNQRDELMFKIIDELENKIPVYDYDQGFPPVIVTQLGALDPYEIRGKIIKVLPELTEKMYYRSTVSFMAEYESSGG